jgi:hypothetical protein
MTIEIGVSQAYSDVFRATSEANTMKIVTSAMMSQSNDTTLELGKHRARFVHLIHGVRKLGLPVNSIHPDDEAS